MSVVRAVVGGLLVLLALGLQISLFPHLAWRGVVPNLVLLVVVAAALSCSGRYALVLAFTGGVLMDLVGPADHYAGRWALALVVVAWVAARVRQDARPGTLAVLTTVAACSFIGTSVFALTGLLLRDPVVGVGEMLTVIGVAVLFDLLLTPVVLPLTMRALRRVAPAGAERVTA
ncbi:rod shape-determining protein MreD [Nocardioides sp. Y6]|uniref:Rod shape-determining protein MreD n=1 Tax=Nocardioides malaquae TaxID=2773426 RepID=A0ABR9RU75_9ACTN|nr:rod shape-determining protein MreD [Nocardioides malaquae]MBE7325119.1 rod shape-determining protein MreD [Nocardioides malaquae]